MRCQSHGDVITTSNQLTRSPHQTPATKATLRSGAFSNPLSCLCGAGIGQDVWIIHRHITDCDMAYIFYDNLSLSIKSKNIFLTKWHDSNNGWAPEISRCTLSESRIRFIFSRGITLRLFWDSNRSRERVANCVCSPQVIPLAKPFDKPFLNL